MKKNNNKASSKIKRILPLLASVALISGPVLAVIGCSSEISRYPAALPNDLQNRILFNFVGVNYSVNAKSQFSAAYQQEMDFIKKEVEGIMAQQKFYNIFVQKLQYSPDEANNAFEKIKDNLGLNILAAEYFNTVNSGQSFDNKVYKSKLIFQTENWHQMATIKFEYDNVPFYNEENTETGTTNNPDKIFTAGYLYEHLNDDLTTAVDQQIELVAKHADKNFQTELPALTKTKLRWDNPAPEIQLPASLGSDNNIQDYQKKLQRFKWWLRFRYQQYYQATILPQLNETLFTMANIFDSILNFTTVSGSPHVAMDNTRYAVQLQDWAPNTTWRTNYRWAWEYQTDIRNARQINNNWATEPLPEIVTNDGNLNPLFFTRLASTDQTLKNTVNPALGINGYVNNTSGKPYDSVVSQNNSSGWGQNKDDTGYYWGQNNRGIFAYSAPVYFIDVVQNLDFNYYNTESTRQLFIDTNSGTSRDWVRIWNNTDTNPASGSPFSQYIRGTQDTSNPQYTNLQETKWNTFWDMIYSLSSQADTNANKERATENFNIAAKAIFPEFIRKENIYNDAFWQAVKDYY